MKHRLFLPALMCCLTLAAFCFFVYVRVYESMRDKPHTDWERWYVGHFWDANMLRTRLEMNYGFNSSPPPDCTNDRIIGFRFNLDKPEHAAEIVRDLHESKSQSPELVNETFGVDVYLYRLDDGRRRADRLLLAIRTMMPAPGRTELQGMYQGRTSDVVIENGNNSKTFTPDDFYHPADGSDEAEAFIRALADAPVPEAEEADGETTSDAEFLERVRLDNEAMLTNQHAFRKRQLTQSVFEDVPVLLAATWIDFVFVIVFLLFALRYQDRGIGGRLFPLWLPTILHILLFLLLDVIPPCTSGGDNITVRPVYQFLESAFLVAPLVLFLFALIYGFALIKTKRTNRPLKTAFILFTANVLVQGLIVLSVWIRLQGG